MKIFWDTNLFIYLWERKSFVNEMTSLTAYIEKGCHTLATSTLTLGEILVQPSRSGRPDLVKQYRVALQQLVIIPFEQEAAVYFAKLRADHPALRPPDAIQLACAVMGRCDLVLTNDNRLSGLELASGPRIQSLAEWAESVG